MSACPKCHGVLGFVSHTALETVEARPLQCATCKGIWVRPGTVEWLKGAGLLEGVDSTDTSRRDPDHRTGVCPEGHGIMTRARVSREAPYYLERCSRCGGIWFDAGEWNRIASDRLVEHIEDLWAPSWRRHLAKAESADHLQAQLEASFGPELHALLDTVAAQLAGRDDAGMALAYLSERVRVAKRALG
jgi:Zn-finger nucleic acid-binding protein